MAESFSVKAILSAADSGFSSTLKKCSSVVEGISSKISGLAFGFMSGAGTAAFNAITSTASGLISEIDSSNASWKTFASNMKIAEANGVKLEGSIDSIKGELQDFATKTVYSASDMATTYAQLAAVGTKNTTKLVKGFGGLAAAAENPQQAMKTLSQQATQMAAKPTVAWADFKLILEQTPAGMAAIANAMGMTTSELVTAVQDGKVKTEDFFNTIAKVGGDANGQFMKMATEAKTMGQAMDGLQETVSNKLQPAWDVLSKVGIKAISGLADKIGAIDASGLAKKVESAIGIVQNCLTKAQRTFKKVKTAAQNAFGAVGDALGLTLPKFEKTDVIKGFAKVLKKVSTPLIKVFGFVKENAGTFASAIQTGMGIAQKIWGAFSGTASKVGGAIRDVVSYILSNSDVFMEILGAGVEACKPYWDAFTSALTGVIGIIKKVAVFIVENKDKIVELMPYIAGAVAAFKGFKLVKTVLPFISSFATSLGSIVTKVGSGLASKIFGVGKATEKTGKQSSTSGKQMLTSAKSFALMGVGVLAVAAGFALLAFSAIQLANSGGLAIGVMAGLVIAVFALGAGMLYLLNNIKPGPKKLKTIGDAMLKMGVAVLLVAVGFALLAQASIALANSGGLAIGVMAGMVIAFAALGLGMALLLKMLTPMAPGMILAATSMILMGAAVVILAVGLGLLAAVAITLANSGGLAIGVMAGLVVVLAGLMVLAAVLGPAMTAGAVGFIAFGAAIALVGLGAVLAAAALAIVSAVLPAIVANGLQGAISIAALGAAMYVFGAGALVAGAGAVVLGAGLLVAATGLTAVAVAVLLASAGVLVFSAGVMVLAAGVMLLAGSLTLVGAALMLVATTLPLAAVGAMLLATGFTLLLAMSLSLAAALVAVEVPLALVGATALIASAGMIAFGAGMTISAGGALIMAGALVAVNSSMKGIANNAKSAEKSLSSMQKSVDVVDAGLDALGDKAKSAMDKLKSAFSKAEKDAKTSGTNVAQGFTMGMMTGLATAPMVAITSVMAVNAALRSGYSSAYSSGAYISRGFALGMLSCLSQIRSAATQMAAAADAAVRAKAKIHSPSKVAEGLGEYWGEGYAGGLLNMVGNAWDAAKELVSIPQVATPVLAGSYGYELSGDYEYSRNSDYTIEVPLTVDGREVARATATYTEAELNRRQTREDRKKGKV